MRHPQLLSKALCGIAPVLRAGAFLVLAACAHSAEAAPPAQTPATTGAATIPAGQTGQPVADSDAAALEAAKQHPIAHPEPRPPYPAEAPPPRPERGLPDQAPPPRERGLPEQAPPPRPLAPEQTSRPGDDREAPAADVEPAEVQVVAPQQPPLEPYAETPPPAPAPNYVWAPGYWYWYGGRYVWIGGGWLPPRPGHVYVSARWVYRGNGWVFTPGGWAVGIGGPVVYPVYPHYYPRHYHHHHSWRDHSWRGRSWREPHRWDAPRRSVVRPHHSYDPPRRHGNLRPATVVPRGSSGSARPAVPAPSRNVRRDGDRVRVYPKRR